MNSPLSTIQRVRPSGANLLASFFGWLLFVAFIGFGFGWMGGGKELLLAKNLEAKGIRTTGNLTMVRAGDNLNSASATYTFTYNGALTIGYSHVDSPDSLRAGQSVQVLYLPGEPTQSGIDPVAMATSGRRGVLIASVLIGVVTIFVGLQAGVGALLGGRSLGLAFPSGTMSVRSAPPGNLGVARFVGGIFVFAGLWLLFGQVLPNNREIGALRERGAYAAAVVTSASEETDDKGHPTGKELVTYDFDVAGRQVHGKSKTPEGETPAVGAQMTIRYLPENASISRSAVEVENHNPWSGILFSLVWLAFSSGLIWVVSRQMKRAGLH